MEKVAIITDSNSGMTQQEGKETGIFIVPMPFFINGIMYYEDINLTQEEFYHRLEEDEDISTSQPTPADVMDLWEKVLKEYDEIVYIPMSSGLSGSCATAVALSEDYDKRVKVVNNKRISVTQRQSVLKAKRLADAGKSAQEIKETLEKEALETSIYLGLDTLKYLKKGGRITSSAAAIGTVLNLKPVLQIQGEKLDAYAKVRGWKSAKKVMLDAMEKDFQTRFKGVNMSLMAAYSGSGSMESALEWKREVEERFPQYEVYMASLALSIACHTGAGVRAIACTKNEV